MEVRPGAGDGAGDRAAAGSAAAAVRDYLLEQVSALHWAVADGDVHDARVACRRARSVLLAHADLVVEHHRGPLSEIAGSARDLGRDLSPVRDAEVVEEVVRSWAAEGRWPDGRLDAALRLVRPDGAGDETETALERARTGLLGLADRVATLAASPVWGPAGAEPAVAGLRPGRAREAARLVDRVRAARDGDLDPAEHPRWHDVRKAAKRLRYTAEVAHRAGDLEAGEQAVSARRLQTALGDLQDLRLVGDRLDEVRTTTTGDALTDELAHQVERTSATARSDLATALADGIDGQVGGSRGPTTTVLEDLT